MMESTQLRQSLRRLLLPMRPAAEEECLNTMRVFFNDLGIDEDNYLDWISLHLGIWEDRGILGEVLLRLIESLLKAADAGFGPSLGSRWIKIYNKLQSEHFFTHNEVRFFFSHSFLIIDLATRDRLSAAQISRLLSERDRRVRFSRQCVFDFLEALKIDPGISKEQVQHMLDMDNRDELRYLADADIGNAADIVDDAARQLGFPGDLGSCLKSLFKEGNINYYMPYIQILHYQCIVAEHYDHAVTDFYEFKPRGSAVNFLLSCYPSNIVEAGNPYLNNAKSVESITRSWVRSKKATERLGAGVLFDILSRLDEMGFTARREVSWLIRLWISRVIRLSTERSVIMPESLTVSQWERLLRHVAKGNTRTYGILEQRIVDAVASTFHSDASRWRSRGLGASVNATNISQRKLGDCDFQCTRDLKIVAYEAHGGKLSPIYVYEHIRTMEKAARERAEELKGIADISEWDITVNYIAHNIDSIDVREKIISNVRVKFEFLAYKDFIENYIKKGIKRDHLDSYVLTPIKEARTPNKVREDFLRIISD